MYERASRLTSRQQGKLIEHFVLDATARVTSEVVGVNVKTATAFFMHQRWLIASNLPSYELSGEIEADESYFGGVRKVTHGRGDAVKAVEIGDGFAAVALRGEQNADRLRKGADGVEFLSNHAGGILGGISSGQPVVVRFAVKPTSSILTPVETVTKSGENADIVTKGRHDPCVGIRAVPVGEAMMAVVLADALLSWKAQRR